MNWKRIWSGALLAGTAMFALGAFMTTAMAWSSKSAIDSRWVMSMIAWSLPAHLVDGFFCSWLYALMRPRLGPGPRSALAIGGVLFLIKHGTVLVSLPLMLFGGSIVSVVMLLGQGVKLLVGTYLAGWQYIEKAPE